MINIVYSFIGCFFALLIHDVIVKVNKPKQAEPRVFKRETPKNIGRFSDPLGNYEPYKDDKTHLYKSYVPKKVNRRGGDINE